MEGNSEMRSDLPLLSSGSSTEPYFIRSFGQLNGELSKALENYKAKKGSFENVKAAAYNLLCFIKDNQDWLSSSSKSPSKDQLHNLSTLLELHRNENENNAVQNYTSAMNTIHSNITTSYFSQE